MDGIAKLLIFDCDGVLVDSEPIAARVASQVMVELGFPVTAEKLMSDYAGLSAASVTRALEYAHNRTAPIGIDDLRREKIMWALTTELLPIPGILSALESLPLPMCVASSSHPERIELSLRVTGLAPLFGANVFNSSMVVRGKPAPDLFLYAAERMGFPPERCVVVEDSVAGVQAGRAANMHVLGFCGGGHCRLGHAERLMAAGADQVFSSMTDLRRLLRAS